jgi:AcrR family transcriptional regulator
VKRKKKIGTTTDQETVTRLLDAAERLFGLHGYDGVGMRMLADEAKVNLGATTYHFGSKEALYVETFMRRFRPSNAERLRLLREAEALADGHPVPVEKIVECMLRPPYDSGREHKAFQRFLARNLLIAPEFLESAIHKELAPEMAAFTAALKRALPDIPEDLIHLRSMLAMGGMLMFTIRTCELPEMQNLNLHEAVLREMVGYATAGMKSLPVIPQRQRPRLPMPPPKK